MRVVRYPDLRQWECMNTKRLLRISGTVPWEHAGIRGYCKISVASKARRRRQYTCTARRSNAAKAILQQPLKIQAVVLIFCPRLLGKLLAGVGACTADSNCSTLLLCASMVFFNIVTPMSVSVWLVARAVDKLAILLTDMIFVLRCGLQLNNGCIPKFLRGNIDQFAAFPHDDMT